MLPSRSNHLEELINLGCISAAFGDDPPARVVPMLRDRGLVDAQGRLTDDGWSRANDAIGFMGDDQ